MIDHQSREVKETFMKEGYKQKLADEQLEKIDQLVRDDQLQEKDRKIQHQKRIPLILTCNQFLWNFTAVVCKNWNILQTNKNVWEFFQEHPITTFSRKKI